MARPPVARSWTTSTPRITGFATFLMCLVLTVTGPFSGVSGVHAQAPVPEAAGAESLGVVPFADTLRFASILGLPRVGRGGRNAIFSNPVEAEIARGAWKPPVEGAAVAVDDSTTVTWARYEPGLDGWYENEELAGGFAFATLDAPDSRRLSAGNAGIPLRLRQRRPSNRRCLPSGIRPHSGVAGGRRQHVPLS